MENPRLITALEKDMLETLEIAEATLFRAAMAGVPLAEASRDLVAKTIQKVKDTTGVK